MQKIKKILCATDLSKFSDNLFFWGVELSLRFNASLSVCHVIPPPLDSVTRQVEFERGGEKNERVEKASEKIKKIMDHSAVAWDLAVTYGDPVRETARVAKKMQADIVIAASHGLSGFQQFFIGSIIGQMAQTMVHPFLVIPPGKAASDTNRPKLEFKNIILACSLSESDHYLKKYALAFSEKFNSEICLVHAMESPLKQDVVESTCAPYEDVQKRLEEKLSLRLKQLMHTQTHILHGVPGEELVLYAKRHNIDLIIAGIDDRPGRIIATTTAALLRYLPCAVLTVPVK